MVYENEICQQCFRNHVLGKDDVFFRLHFYFYKHYFTFCFALKNAKDVLLKSVAVE